MIQSFPILFDVSKYHSTQTNIFIVLLQYVTSTGILLRFNFEWNWNHNFSVVNLPLLILFCHIFNFSRMIYRFKCSFREPPDTIPWLRVGSFWCYSSVQEKEWWVSNNYHRLSLRPFNNDVEVFFVIEIVTKW